MAAAGFSAEDIASIRTQFHSQSSREFLDQDFANEDDCELSSKCLGLAQLDPHAHIDIRRDVRIVGEAHLVALVRGIDAVLF